MEGVTIVFTLTTHFFHSFIHSFNFLLMNFPPGQTSHQPPCTFRFQTQLRLQSHLMFLMFSTVLSVGTRLIAEAAKI